MLGTHGPYLDTLCVVIMAGIPKGLTGFEVNNVLPVAVKRLSITKIDIPISARVQMDFSLKKLLNLISPSGGRQKFVEQSSNQHTYTKSNL